MAALVKFPADTRFNLCLFWDVFNYLDAAAITGLMSALRPHLYRHSLGHGFAVHNTRSAQQDAAFEILGENALKLRPRNRPLPGYAPHGQSRLKELLNCYRFERTVLLADGRLEILLRSSL